MNHNDETTTYLKEVLCDVKFYARKKGMKILIKGTKSSLFFSIFFKRKTIGAVTYNVFFSLFFFRFLI